LYKQIVAGGHSVSLREALQQFFRGTEGLAEARAAATLSVVLPQATIVFDDAHRLYKQHPDKFENMLIFLRDAVYHKKGLKVILLTSEMETEALFRNNRMSFFFECARAHALL